MKCGGVGWGVGSMVALWKWLYVVGGVWCVVCVGYDGSLWFTLCMAASRRATHSALFCSAFLAKSRAVLPLCR